MISAEVVTPLEAMYLAVFCIAFAKSASLGGGIFFTKDKIADASTTTPVNRPCLYVVQVAEHTSQESAFGENRWVLYFTLEVYAQADAASAAVPDTLINAILDGIEFTIQSKPKGMPQTLGGIVTNCWIEGEIVLGTGQIETQLMMLVPIRIVTGI